MDSIQGIISKLLEKMPPETGTSMESQSFDVEQSKVDSINAIIGSLPGYDCPLCLNRGYTAELRDGYVTTIECSCMTKRRYMRLIRESGLERSLRENTFDRYNTPQPWQVDAKAQAQKYAKDWRGHWFFIGGTVGSGKTHLCTAICGELLNAGIPLRYLQWRADAPMLKSAVKDGETYRELITPLKTVRALYIDDLFKGGITDADINLAFDLLNIRYSDPSLATIISSEKTIKEIVGVDEGIGTRILERSRGYCTSVTGKEKNWRLYAGK